MTLSHFKLIEIIQLKTSWFKVRRKIPDSFLRAGRGSRRCGRCGQRGLTLLELMIVIAIIGILSGLTVPFYFGQVQKARVIKATAELEELQMEIVNFEIDYGRLPETLDEVKSASLTDPWGNPYHYLNFDLLEAEESPGPEENANGNGNGNAYGKGKGKGKGKAKGKGKDKGDGNDNSSATEAEDARRRDLFNEPLNSDYDLYSCGKDGKSAAPIDDPLSEDDIVRGRDGAYIGLASHYEP